MCGNLIMRQFANVLMGEYANVTICQYVNGDESLILKRVFRMAIGRRMGHSG